MCKFEFNLTFDTSVIAEPDQKLSKAAKRRIKKAEEEKAARDRIAAAMKEDEEKFIKGEFSPKIQEQQDLQETVICHKTHLCLSCKIYIFNRKRSKIK